ncbi:MAG: serine protease [Legionella sp.]|uniref:S1 family peptidase n=1 Tax=Legionella sp. TaxID=459 RepID=UPI00284563AB|nr:serine protease [Legionella sp.]
MEKFVLAVVIYLLLVPTVFAAQIPPFYLDSTVVIGVPTEPNKVSWIGTGFILGVLTSKVESQKSYNTFIVTNKHVINNLDSIYVRFNPEVGNHGKDYLIQLIIDKKPIWVGHHDKDIDIAVIPINVSILSNDKMKFNFFRDDEHIFKINDMKEIGITEGDPIYLLGYPFGIVDENSQYVIARYGIIARIRDTLANHGKGFLIDTKNYPGNSGGPVILKTEAMSIEGTKSVNKAQLIGIVNSYIPYIDVAISTQTKRPRITFEENSGLANVIPVDYILETIDEFKNNFINSK